MPLVSIIVPIYNVEKYLEECVESLCNQTYKNIEIILVDDGSPDNCPKICDEYAQKDNRIVVIHKKNGGLSDARNEGLKKASGDYVFFIDSDDFIDTNTIQIMVNKIEQLGCDLVVCDFVYVNSKGELIDSNSLDKESELLSSIEAQRRLTKKDGWRLIPAWNKLYTRKSLNNIVFPFGKIHEDEYVIHHILNNCESIYWIKLPLYYYRQRSGSIMDKETKETRSHGLSAQIDRINFYNEKKLYDLVLFWSEDFFLKISHQDKSAYKRKMLSNLSFLFNNKGYVKNLSVFKRIKQKIGIKYLFLWYIINLFESIRRRIIILNKERKDKKGVSKIKNLLCRIRNEGNSPIILLSTPTHGNLGDQAIIDAEKRYFRDKNTGNRLCEISSDIYTNNYGIIDSLICNEDTIIISGGGNMGTLWPEENKNIMHIVSTHRTKKIIIFPQTIFYANNNIAKQQLKLDSEILNDCSRLYLFVRDKQSFTFAINHFAKNVYLVPDMVLYNEYKNFHEKRDGVMLCFRSDKERVLYSDIVDRIEETLNKKSIKHYVSSTVVHKKVDYKNREKILKDKLKEFSSYKLIITDRLHAMIFSIITATPCIAFDNISKKVSGVYSQVKDVGFVTIIDEFNEAKIQTLIENMLNNRWDKTESNFKDGFRQLDDIVNGVI